MSETLKPVSPDEYQVKNTPEQPTQRAVLAIPNLVYLRPTMQNGLRARYSDLTVEERTNGGRKDEGTNGISIVQKPREVKREPILTDQQTEILLLAAHGLSPEKIDQTLGISEKFENHVEHHLSNINEKLGARSITASVLSAIDLDVFNQEELGELRDHYASKINAVSRLAPRQKEVLETILEGTGNYSYRQMREKLELKSNGSLGTHIKRARANLGLHPDQPNHESQIAEHAIIYKLHVLEGRPEQIQEARLTDQQKEILLLAAHGLPPEKIDRMLNLYEESEEKAEDQLIKVNEELVAQNVTASVLTAMNLNVFTQVELDGLRDRYADNIKAVPNLTPRQKKVMETIIDGFGNYSYRQLLRKLEFKYINSVWNSIKSARSKLGLQCDQQDSLIEKHAIIYNLHMLDQQKQILLFAAQGVPLEEINQTLSLSDESGETVEDHFTKINTRLGTSSVTASILKAWETGKFSDAELDGLRERYADNIKAVPNLTPRQKELMETIIEGAGNYSTREIADKLGIKYSSSVWDYKRRTSSTLGLNSGYKSPELRIAELAISYKFHILDGRPENTPKPELAGEDKDVLLHIARGFTNLQIAGEFYRSTSAIKRQIETINAKLGTSDRVAAVVTALEEDTFTPKEKEHLKTHYKDLMNEKLQPKKTISEIIDTSLTHRQKGVMEAITVDKGSQASNAALAEKLSITKKTVKSHQEQIKKNLKISATRTALAVISHLWQEESPNRNGHHEPPAKIASNLIEGQAVSL